MLWFHVKFNVELYTTVRAFKAARLIWPVTVTSLNPTPEAIQQLPGFPSLDTHATIQGLLEELLLYLAAAEDVTINHGTTEEPARKKLEFGGRTRIGCTQAVRNVVLAQPSSASTKRMFSLLQIAFGISNTAARALADYFK